MLKNRKCLIFSLLLSLALLVGHLRGSRLLILASLVGYLGMLGLESANGFTLPVLLYFLPWSLLMKLTPGSFSFFTLGLVEVCFVTLIRRKFVLGRTEVVTGLALVLLTLVSKLISGYGLALNYVAFFMLVLLLPSLKRECREDTYDFETATVYFALGAAFAALLALRYATSPGLRPYITVHSWYRSSQKITRYCGFYGDANFYCAQITAAISGLLILLLRAKGRQVPGLAVLTVVLMYCGFLSGSKSFFLVLGLILILWLWLMLRMRRKAGQKLLLAAAALVAAVVVLRSTQFRGLIDMVLVRFGGKTLSDFTTKRTDLWIMYLKELLTNGKLLLLGCGFTDVIVQGRASHNSLIQMIFQFGLIGSGFLVYWCLNLSRGVRLGSLRRRGRLPEAMMLCCGIFLPWMALDILFFDEFFLLQWYFLLEMGREMGYNEKIITIDHSLTGGNDFD